MEGTKMKQTIKTSRTAGYLEKLFRTLNERYFDNTIEEPIITIQSTPRAYGHITVAKAWRKGNGDLRHELNIAADRGDRCHVTARDGASDKSAKRREGLQPRRNLPQPEIQSSRRGVRPPHRL
jgi:hypothetical protein